MKRFRRALLPAGLACTLACAQPLAPSPPVTDAGLHLARGAQLPLDQTFLDSEGRPATLRQILGGPPVVLVLGYYRCTQLCGLLMQGLLQALQQGRLPREGYRLLRVSIDAQEGPADARARRAADLAYAAFLEGAESAPQPLDLGAWTASAASIQALTRAVGFRFRQDLAPNANGGRPALSHPAALIIVTPEGRVSQAMGGVRFDPWELRLALAEAGRGRVGDLAVLRAHLALLCAHVDPRWGRHSATVLLGLQVLCASLALGLLGLFWHQRRRERR